MAQTNEEATEAREEILAQPQSDVNAQNNSKPVDAQKPEEQKVEGTFYIKCEKNGNEQQLGDMQTFALNKLLLKKQTFKGLVVPGGKADMMFTALDFGDEQAEEEDDAFMDFL